MMYICPKCGWTGEDSETRGDPVPFPEWKNDPEYQDSGTCPNCLRRVVEAAVCAACLEYVPAADLIDETCPGCRAPD